VAVRFQSGGKRLCRFASTSEWLPNSIFVCRKGPLEHRWRI